MESFSLGSQTWLILTGRWSSSLGCGAVCGGGANQINRLHPRPRGTRRRRIKESRVRTGL